MDPENRPPSESVAPPQGDELRHQLDRLRSSDRHKTELLDHLAHELGNLLVPLKVTLHLAQRPGQDFAKLAEDTIRGEVEQLTEIIAALRRISRLSEVPKVIPHPLDLVEVARRTAQQLAPQLQSRRQALRLELPSQPLTIAGEADLLEQALIEVLTNALRHTPDDGEIALCVASEDQQAIVRVSDTGCGFDPAARHRIFEPFVQLDPTAERPFGQIGLGLALARSLIAAHGGSIEAHSPGKGQGCQVEIRLPQTATGPTRPSPRAAAPRPTQTAPSQRLKVLVVDDNLDASRALSLLLKTLGHDVRVAHDGRQGLQLAESFAPQLVLLDLALPEVNGYEVARRIRANPLLADVFLVAVSGWGRDEDRRRSQAAGFDRHLLKPVETATLAALLAEISPAR